MTEYILGVVGMVVLAATIDIILPSGKMSVFVRSVVAVFLFFVIVSPLAKVVKRGNVIDDIIDSVDSQFVIDITDSQVNAAKQQVQKSIKSNFGFDSDVEIEYISEKGVASFLKVSVFLANDENKANTNDIEMIGKYVKRICGDVEVCVYG